MRNNIDNPLFKSLITSVNNYNSIFEQAPKGTDFSDFSISMAALGTKLVNQYCVGIGTYPDTKIKRDYIKTLPDKINKFANSVDDKKTIVVQIKALIEAVILEMNVFLESTMKDEEYTKYLKSWRDQLRTGFGNYKQAITVCTDYISKQEGTGKEVGYTQLKKSILDLVDVIKKKNLSDETINAGKELHANVNDQKKITDSITKLINNKICVDFSTFNGINVNEKKEDRVARRKAKTLKGQLSNLTGQINSVLMLIAARENDAEGNKFKYSASAKQTDFLNIQKQLNTISDQINTEDENILKSLNFDDLTGEYNKYLELFNSKKTEYQEAYKKEENVSKTTKVLNIAVPEIGKYIKDGDAAFDDLASLSLNAANQALILRSQTKKVEDVKTEKKGDKLGKEVKRSSIKKGTKDVTVEKFQKDIVEKYKEDKIISNSKVYKDLKSSLDAGQGGYFGPRTESMIKALKAGFKLSDKTSDITQELMDKINSQKIVKESLLLEQDFDYSAFGGGVTPTPNKKSVKKSPISKKAVEVAKTEKTIPNEVIKKAIEESPIQKRDREDVIKDLIDFDSSIKENPDYGKGGQLAIATSKWMRFYAKNVALRLFDKKIGKYDLDDNIFKADGEDNKDNLRNLIKGSAPIKFKSMSVFFWGNSFVLNVSKGCKKIMDWSPDDIHQLDTLYREDNDDKKLDDLLRKNKENSDVKSFRDKFVAILSQ